MFEVVGHAILRAVGLRKPTNEDIYGSLYTRPEEGPAEFVTGLIACVLFVVIVGAVFR